MNRIVHSVIGDGSESVLIVTDLMNSTSIQVPGFSARPADFRDAVMEIIGAEHDTDSDPIADIRALLRTKRTDEITAMRKELGVEVDSEGGFAIAGQHFPERLSEMLAGITDIEDARAVVRFAERLATNPYPHVRPALIEWILANPDLCLTRDGRVIGYRGLREDFHSIRTGYGIVNGVEIANGSLDNSPGNRLQYPREMVDMNPGALCSVGLHVGTWEYADGYSKGARVSVVFAPEDVVSSPNDAAQHKIRVCDMTILSEVSAPYAGGIIDLDSEQPRDNEVATDDNDDDNE